MSACSRADSLSARLGRIGHYKTRALSLTLNEDELRLGDPRRLRVLGILGKGGGLAGPNVKDFDSDGLGVRLE